jgi:5'(3')-deoxyribonucleotidase
VSVVLLDVDGVQADFVADFLPVVKGVTGRAHTHDQVTRFKFSECIISKEESGECWKQIDRLPGLVRTMREIGGAREALAEIRTFADVKAVTSPHLGPHWMYERYQWLMARGYSKYDIILASDKTHIRGATLVDDHLENCSDWAWANPGRSAVLFDQPWNQTTELPAGVIRAKGWPQALRIVAQLVGS